MRSFQKKTKISYNDRQERRRMKRKTTDPVVVTSVSTSVATAKTAGEFSQIKTQIVSHDTKLQSFETEIQQSLLMKREAILL